ncbi:MAG TPA: ABC transporter permease [Planctomycetota bacterium]|nr:ABC transporter permease [Planctomycetota bacterium]
MGLVFTIAWKEFRSFLTSPLAYIFVCIFLLMTGGIYYVFEHKVAFDANGALHGWFSKIPWAFAVLVPALAMKLWPDELKSGTIELLMSYPVRPWQVVVGKYVAGLMLLLGALALTLAVPMTIGDYGELDWGPAIGAYVGALLVGGAFLAMGLFFGALAKEQVTAFVLTLFFCLILAALGTQLARMLLPTALGPLQDHLSFTARFNYLARGVVPLADVLYFLLFTVAFLVLNVTVLECRKGK